MTDRYRYEEMVVRWSDAVCCVVSLLRERTLGCEQHDTSVCRRICSGRFVEESIEGRTGCYLPLLLGKNHMLHMLDINERLIEVFAKTYSS